MASIPVKIGVSESLFCGFVFGLNHKKHYLCLRIDEGCSKLWLLDSPAEIFDMCLAIPGKIKKIENQLATVDFNGVEKTVNVSLVDVGIGDYVMVHAGFAIEKMDLEYMDSLKEYLGK